MAVLCAAISQRCMTGKTHTGQVAVSVGVFLISILTRFCEKRFANRFVTPGYR
jgi:hypothetical protein